MTLMHQVGGSGSRWLDAIAAAVVSAVGRVGTVRAVRVVEDADGHLTVLSGRKGTPQTIGRMQVRSGRVDGALTEPVAVALRGSRIELLLLSSRFLFRPLELPARASEFLDGIVRNQIDRLTPWSATDASFGRSAPMSVGTDRIAVTVAAAPRTQISDLVRQFSDLGAESIAVTTLVPDGQRGGSAIKVFDEAAAPTLDPERVRRGLAAVLLVAVVAATTSIAAATVMGANLSAEQEELSRRIAERRSLMRGGAAVAPTALRRLEARKHEAPSSVIVLDAVSQILPDHTYLTEFRVEGDKVRLIGVTRDAPALIRLMEQSAHFTRATFFAPTTRQPADPGERFYIEARIEPVFTPQ